MLAEAQKGAGLAAAAADAVAGQGAVGPAAAPAVAVVVARVDGVQAGGVEEGLHKGDGFGAGVGIALLGERDVGVEAWVVGAGDRWVGLRLEIYEGEGGYVDKGEGGKGPVLALLCGI